MYKSAEYRLLKRAVSQSPISPVSTTQAIKNSWNDVKKVTGGVKNDIKNIGQSVSSATPSPVKNFWHAGKTVANNAWQNKGTLANIAGNAAVRTVGEGLTSPLRYQPADTGMDTLINNPVKTAWNVLKTPASVASHTVQAFGNPSVEGWKAAWNTVKPGAQTAAPAETKPATEPSQPGTPVQQETKQPVAQQEAPALAEQKQPESPAAPSAEQPQTPAPTPASVQEQQPPTAQPASAQVNSTSEPNYTFDPNADAWYKSQMAQLNSRRAALAKSNTYSPEELEARYNYDVTRLNNVMQARQAKYDRQQQGYKEMDEANSRKAAEIKAQREAQQTNTTQPAQPQVQANTATAATAPTDYWGEHTAQGQINRRAKARRALREQAKEQQLATVQKSNPDAYKRIKFAQDNIKKTQDLMRG